MCKRYNMEVKFLQFGYRATKLYIQSKLKSMFLEDFDFGIDEVDED